MSTADEGACKVMQWMTHSILGFLVAPAEHCRAVAAGHVYKGVPATSQQKTLHFSVHAHARSDVGSSNWSCSDQLGLWPAGPVPMAAVWKVAPC